MENCFRSYFTGLFGSAAHGTGPPTLSRRRFVIIFAPFGPCSIEDTCPTFNPTQGVEVVFSDHIWQAWAATGRYLSLANPDQSIEVAFSDHILAGLSPCIKGTGPNWAKSGLREGQMSQPTSNQPTMLLKKPWGPSEAPKRTNSYQGAMRKKGNQWMLFCMWQRIHKHIAATDPHRTPNCRQSVFCSARELPIFIFFCFSVKQSKPTVYHLARNIMNMFILFYILKQNKNKKTKKKAMAKWSEIFFIRSIFSLN
jgi:hypothetical protein